MQNESLVIKKVNDEYLYYWYRLWTYKVTMTLTVAYKILEELSIRFASGFQNLTITIDIQHLKTLLGDSLYVLKENLTI